MYIILWSALFIVRATISIFDLNEREREREKSYIYVLKTLKRATLGDESDKLHAHRCPSPISRHVPRTCVHI